MEDKSKKICEWLDSHPLISINRMCKMIELNTANFMKYKKIGVILEKYTNKLEGILKEYGYIIPPEKSFGELLIEVSGEKHSIDTLMKNHFFDKSEITTYPPDPGAEKQTAEFWEAGKSDIPGFEGIIPALKNHGKEFKFEQRELTKEDLDKIVSQETTGKTVTVNITEENHRPQKQPGEKSLDYQLRVIAWEESRLKQQKK